MVFMVDFVLNHQVIAQETMLFVFVGGWWWWLFPHCEDFGRMFSHPLPSCAFSVAVKVEISSHKLIPLDFGRMFNHSLPSCAFFFF